LLLKKEEEEEDRGFHRVFSAPAVPATMADRGIFSLVPAIAHGATAFECKVRLRPCFQSVSQKIRTRYRFGGDYPLSFSLNL